MAASWLFGVAAQNFDETIFDTEDLSTIRGASIAAIECVEGFKFDGLTDITLGSSSGIWSYDGDKPEDIGVEFQRKTFSDTVTQHLCFASAYVSCSNDYLADKKALAAKLARRQLQQAGLVYPSDGNKSRVVCPVELARPVQNKTIWFGGEKRAVSQSVLDRRNFGLKQKQQFVKTLACGERTHDIFKIAGLGAERRMAMLMSSISEQAAPPNDLKTNLRDKIAVIHLDGNRAGTMQDALINAATDYEGQCKAHTAFDTSMRALRRALAEAVLGVLQAHGGYGAPSEDEQKVRENINVSGEAVTNTVIRFEALLWAGDEITFIVPARLGWQVTRALLAVMESDTGSIGGSRLTAAIGLIFCHHDAPIARIRKLADRLCTHAKKVNHEKNLVFPLVLESFDHIGNGLSDYLARRAPKEGRDAFFLVDSDQMNSFQKQATDWANPDANPSRRQLRRMAFDAHRGKAPPTDYVAREVMLIEDYWDYLNPCETAGEAS
jgi:hypothetical protein